VFAGDGAQRAEFEQRVADLGLQDHFQFLGRRNDIAEILRCSDIGVLPSKAEGLPNAILEYMSAGLPTVASAVGGNTEVVKEGKTGLLVPAQNANALAGALLQLLEDPAMASSMGESAQSYVTANFSFARLIREVDELYSELLEKKN
jgi:glycosyltransferase involved in cell wall biosynthesis